jgi:type 1 glutamine amidotransferase
MTTQKVSLTRKLSLVLSLLALMAAMAVPAQAAPKKVLVVTVTEGFVHSSIPTAERILGELGQKSRGEFTVDYARVHQTDPEFKGADGKPDKAKVHEAIRKVLAEKMSPKALQQYDLVIFANTTGDLPLPDNQAFLDWIKSGKGFVGMHAASDTFHHFQPYIEMLGAEFKTHGPQVEVEIINQDPCCPACSRLPLRWNVFDEIYQFKNFDRAQVHGLLTLDKHPNDKTPGDYPVSWCKQYGKTVEPPANGAALLMKEYWPRKAGRVFYTSLGHREDVWDPAWPDRKNPKEVAEAYQAHILGGIRWALGLTNCKPAPQADACCAPAK